MYFGEGWIWLIQWIYYCFKLFIEMLVPSQESGRSYICVKGIDFDSFDGFLLNFLKCSYSVVYFCFHAITEIDSL